jgi:phosphotransferase system enzyme I (PtsI)
MWPALEIKGRAASDGIFAGPMVYLGATSAMRRHSGSIAGERQALEAAITEAIAEITALMEKAEGAAAGILAFQVAMLEDTTLRAPALAAISDKLAADRAWATALDAEIAGYEASSDDYFRARSADLKDIRDRVLRLLSGIRQIIHASGAVLAGEDVAPTIFLETDWSHGGAIALTGGSVTSHVAMLARARGVPMVVGLGSVDFRSHNEIIVDGESGLVILDPAPDAYRFYEERSVVFAARRAAEDAFLLRKARRKDGTPIEILLNVASVEELDHIDPKCCDGIGLMRSEVLFRDGEPLPDEEQQYRAYRRFLEWAEGKPVTIRTLDIGGDKPIRGLTQEGEKNPFLGLRGVRLMLANPDVFRTQLRALARAAVHGKLKIMIPMITTPQEFAQTAALLDECIAELGGNCARPPLGIMVEVPAVAIAPELFAEAAFFSIGSNDLTQYVTAAARDEAPISYLNESTHPAVMRLIASVCGFGQANNMPVSLCGDMASDPAHLVSLMAAGLRSLSVAPARVARIKSALAEI